MEQIKAKKCVSAFICLALTLSLLFFIAPCCSANADEVEWVEIDYKTALFNDQFLVFNVYRCSVEETPEIWNYRYLYVFIVSSGGMGGSSIDGRHSGYGGGSGAFAVIKIDLAEAENVGFLLGMGGGKFEYEDDNEYTTGDGGSVLVTTARDKSETKPYAFDVLGIDGGKRGTTSGHGEGGSVLRNAIPKGELMSLIFDRDGADGGRASQAFDVDLGFKTVHFGYNVAGASPSGKGGAASVFHKGGNGGVALKIGSDGEMGSGGGGAGLGATQGGFGGDAYMQLYGSNK